MTMSEVVPSNGAGRPLTRPMPRSKPAASSLDELVERFDTIEALDHPDQVLPLAKLRMTPTGLIDVPLLGEFEMTPWSKSQLGRAIGVRWAAYEADASISDIAEEVNRRLARAPIEQRVRTRSAAGGNVPGTLRAFVSPGFAAPSDALLASLLRGLLALDEGVRVSRLDQTDRTTSYMVTVGKKFNPKAGSQVGDVQAGILLRSSQVGAASLLVKVFLERLICLNGMTVEDKAAARLVHRGVDEARLRSLLAKTVGNITTTTRSAADRLVLSTERAIEGTIEDAINRVITSARLPKRLVPIVLEAYAQEPSETAFGVSQALTLAAQTQSPEDRVELEALAGRYLSQLN